MQKTKPIISVIVPAYNEELYLGKCLDSLLRQSLNQKEFEIIVIDNASTDKTSKIAAKYPVKITSEKRKSVVLARQKGAQFARGTIIASADADTTYPKNWLSRIKQDFENDPKLIAVVGWIYFKNSSTAFNLLYALNLQTNRLIHKLTGRFPIVFAANFAFKKTALKAIGGYPPHLPELGDQQYLLYRFFDLGTVTIDPKLFCFTSRRKHYPTWKNVIVYNGWYRIAGYLINQLLGKQIIGPAPAIRKTQRRRKTNHFWQTGQK